MKKFYFRKVFVLCALCTFLLCMQSLAQSKDIKHSSEPFSKLKDALASFLRANKESDNNAVIVVGLSNSFTYPLKFTDSVFKRGVYKFSSTNVHSREYLLFVHDKYYVLVKDYSVESILGRYLSFVNESKINENERVILLRNISLFLDQRNNM